MLYIKFYILYYYIIIIIILQKSGVLTKLRLEIKIHPKLELKKKKKP